MKLMNNHAGSALTRPTEATFSHKVALGGGGGGCLGYPRPYNGGLMQPVDLAVEIKPHFQTLKPFLRLELSVFVELS